MNLIPTVQSMIRFHDGKVEISLEALFEIEGAAHQMREDGKKLPGVWTKVEVELVKKLGEAGRALAVCDLDRAQKCIQRLVEITNPVYEGLEEFETHEVAWMMCMELREKLEALDPIDYLV